MPLNTHFGGMDTTWHRHGADGHAPRGPVGVEHIVALGDASASLGLIATLVFSCGMELLFSFDLEASAANTVELFCVAGACACAAFVLSFALLEFYYAQMLKKTDDMLRAQEETATDDDESSSSAMHTKRVAMRENVDKAVSLLNPMRARSRNAMWLSLMLLMAGGVAHVGNGVRDLYEVIVTTTLGLLVFVSCVTIVNNVQQFRNLYSETTSSTPALRWWPKVGHIDPPGVSGTNRLHTRDSLIKQGSSMGHLQGLASTRPTVPAEWGAREWRSPRTAPRSPALPVSKELL